VPADAGAETDSFRIDIDAHFLLVAIHNGMRSAKRVQTYVRDERLAAAFIDLDRRFPDAKNLRDVLTHLDEYVHDTGRLQNKGVVHVGASSWRQIAEGEIYMHFERFGVPLLGLAAAAATVLALAAEVWHRAMIDADVDGSARQT
jgi:hypothetical protein